jgi:adenosylmethionine-8-amino-7-oxononanoate aminotransferase
LNQQPAKTLAERDAAVIWHPYTQHKSMPALLPVAKGEGIYLVDEEGNRYIDASSSWWTNIHGHAHPYIAEKIYEQALQLEHVIFAGCTHEPAVQLAERLLPLFPGNFSKIFYSDNGSTAVEVALKMAIQYQKNKGEGTRIKIAALRNSYHGDTFGAMSVSERGVFTLAFQDFLFEVVFIEPGTPVAGLHLPFDELACFIYEPLLQAAGGMHIYEAEWLNELLCEFKQNKVLCIADEVMTGFGRTGNLFASEQMHHKPDMICLSKGLTGGSLPLAITACTQQVFDAFLDEDKQKTFFHGHSYTANPIACAAALASLDLLQKEECMEGITLISERHKAFVQELTNKNPGARNPRSIGTVLAFELEAGQNEYLSALKEKIIETAMSRFVFLRPLGNTVYLMPPYCITDKELDQLYDTLRLIITKK